MASLVLGAAGGVLGSFLGGPVGASLGWAIGSAIGSSFQKGTEGPRLQNLRMAASEYGRMIPIVYAGMRVPAQIIWQTDLKEHEDEGGKGGPGITTYSYSASFAALICEGPVNRVQRIWADGTLIYDTTGANPGLPELPITIYKGTATQMPDPTMEAVLGVGYTPAHRGYCYVVFTDWYLTEFGNRIPSLNFEVATTPQAELLSIVKANYETGAWGLAGNNYPTLIRWPAEGSIIINGQTLSSDFTISAVYPIAFDQTNFNASVAPVYDQENIFWPNGNPPPGYRGFGIFSYDSGSAKYLWWSQTYWPIQRIGDYPPIIGDGGGFNPFDVDGLDPSLYLTSACLSQDGYSLYAFTSFVSATSVSTQWFKIQGDQVVASGSVSPPRALRFFGQGCAVSQSNATASFENGGEYMWMIETDQSLVRIFTIDADTNVFAEWGGGTLTIPWEQKDALNRATIMALPDDGFAGAFFGDSLVLLSRFVPGIQGVPLSAIVADQSRRAQLDSAQYNVTQLTPIVDGYIIDRQAAARDNITPLQTAFFFHGVESGGVMKFVMNGGDPLFTIPNRDLATQLPGAKPPPLVEVKRSQELDLPAELSINYINAATDYQVGTQYARRTVTNSQSVVSANLPIVMTDEKAAAVAATNLYNAWTERTALKIALPRKYWRNEPTDVLIANNYLMRLIRKGDEVAGVITFDALLTSASVWIQGPTPAPNEGFTPATPTPFQQSALRLLDIPLVIDQDFSNGFYIVVGPTADTPWTSAKVFKSVTADPASSYSQIASIGRYAISGVTNDALPPFNGGNVIDAASSVTVTLGAGENLTLSSCTYAELLDGANAVLIGDELCNYMTAVEVSAKVYTLTNLLRGRRGTEWAMISHAAGERFVLLPVYDYDADPSELGQLRNYKAVTSGGTLAGAGTVPFTNQGAALRPYSPVHVGGAPITPFDGTVEIRWIRRTRIGGAWNDFTNVPVSEPFEKFIVQIWDSTFTTCARIAEVENATVFVYTAAMQVADFGVIQETIYATIGQMGLYQLGVQTPGVIPGLGTTDDAPLAPVPPYNSSPPPASGGCELEVQTGTLNWATPNVRIYNPDADNSHVWVIELTTGATPLAGVGNVSVAEYDGPPNLRVMTVSLTPCGPRLNSASNSSVGGTAPILWFYQIANPNPTVYPTLLPNTTYYFSVTNAAAGGASALLQTPS